MEGKRLMKKILSKLLLLGTIIGGLIGNKIINVYANELDENLFNCPLLLYLLMNDESQNRTTVEQHYFFEV